jgi:alpha-L-fucosidase
MDFANDDDFTTSWVSNTTVDKPWLEISFDKETVFNTIAIAEEKANISNYALEYYQNGAWKSIFEGDNNKKIKVNRFNRVSGTKVRVRILKSDHLASIAEFGVYNERWR